jgi:glycosyltransferase involved in cell wall biosynthesis
MRFSIIVPSYLGNYANAAKNREQKIVRMIESVMCQTFQDFELIIVADGCERTMEIVKPYFYEYLPKIRLFKVDKQKVWSGKVRNAGILNAKGDIITYVDLDDKLLPNHLQIINDNFGDADWVYYDHLTWSKSEQSFVPYRTNIDVMGMCGTSSISHKRSLNAMWLSNSYLHDKVFIDTLKGISKNYKRIPQTEYCVCHVPNQFDV